MAMLRKDLEKTSSELEVFRSTASLSAKDYVRVSLYRTSGVIMSGYVYVLKVKIIGEN